MNQLSFIDCFNYAVPFKGRAKDKQGKVLNFDPNSWLKSKQAILQDSSISGIRGLKVTLRATASGVLINNRVYPGVHVKKAAKTFVTPFNKPILKHHDSHSDPIGRIVAAKFKQFVTGDEFKNDAKRPAILGLDGAQGTGQIITTGVITDPDSIAKINDSRFSTTSVGFRTSKALCSICAQDWVSEGPCDHIPGKNYPDPKAGSDARSKQLFKMFHITGSLSYDEISFVNKPAYPNSGIIANSLVSQSALDSMNLPEVTIIDSVISELSFVDSIDGTEFIVIEDGEVLTEAVIEISGNTCDECDESIDIEDSDLSEKEKGEFYILSNLFDNGMLDVSGEYSDGYDEDKIISLLSKYTCEDANSNTFCGPNKTFPTNTCKQAHGAMRLLPRFKGSNKGKILACVKRRFKELNCSEQELKSQFKKNSSNDMTITNDKKFSDGFFFAALRDADISINYDLLEKDSQLTESDVDSLIKDFEKTPVSKETLESWGLSEDEITEFVDKPLTTEQRKRLPSGIFCGPDRSFPVPDCARVANAKARLPQSNASNKSRIMSCILRREKKLGCFKKSKGDETITKGDKLDALTAALVLKQDEVQDLSARVEHLQSEVAGRDCDYQELEKETFNIRERYLKILTNSIVTTKLALQRNDVINKTKEELDEYTESLLKFNTDYLFDKWTDLMNEFEAEGPQKKKIEPGIVTSGVGIPAQDVRNTPENPLDALA